MDATAAFRADDYHTNMLLTRATDLVQQHQVRVGTVGWTYDGRVSNFYPATMPRGVDRLAYYARYFSAVEIDATFHSPVTRQVAEHWVAQTAARNEFRFTAKLWERFTHPSTVPWTARDVRNVRVAFDVLQSAEKLGAVVLQFARSFERTSSNRAWVASVVDTFHMYPLVLEMRHHSWNVADFYHNLAYERIGLVNIDHPLYKHNTEHKTRITSPIGYLHVSGRDYRDWFHDAAADDERSHLYTPAELHPWAVHAEQIATDARETFVILDGVHRDHACINAFQMASMLSRGKVRVPAHFFEAHEDVLTAYGHADSL